MGKSGEKEKICAKALTGALKYGIIFERVGEVSEWFKELVLKTSDPARDQEFESLPLRQFVYFLVYIEFFLGGKK